jgi:hypothetical protein
MDQPIFVVITSDDLTPKYRAQYPGRLPNQIVFETNVIGATREVAQQRAAQLESAGYGACRVARLVFDDAPPHSDAPPSEPADPSIVSVSDC